MEQILLCHDALDFHNYIYGLIHSYNKPKVDVICTSPQYNIGKIYAATSDNLSLQEWMDTIIYSLHPTDKICNDGALMFLNLKPNTKEISTYFKAMGTIVQEIEDHSEWKFIQDIIWFMPNKQPIAPTKYVKKFSIYKEYVFMFAKGDHKLDKSRIGTEYSKAYLMDKRYEASRQRQMEMYGKVFRDRGDVWDINILKYNQNVKRFNPTEFPPEFPETCIKVHWDYDRKENFTVYDPFMGGGTTALVANHLGCNFYGCDIAKSYVEATKKRLNKYGRRNKNNIW